MTAVAAIPVRRIERLETALVPGAWPFAEEHRAAIEANFAARQKKTPALWNGRILMLRDHSIDGATFRGSFIEVDYASFLTWHDWGRPEAGAKDCFAQGALRAADGAFLLGVMGPRTSQPGHIYFPSGTPDRSDVSGTAVDLEGSVWREIQEETGLSRADLAAESGWHTVLAGQRFAHIKVMQARENADALRIRILENLSRQAQPELSDIRIARGTGDLDPMMQDFIVAFLADAWA